MLASLARVPRSPIQLFGIRLLGKDSLGKQVQCGTSQVYTTWSTNKGGVIGEPWFPIKLIVFFLHIL
jgi:hypothetical protein